MGFKKNNPGCNCCESCNVADDDFTRSDGTDIDTGSTCGWTEISGSWEISSNQLKCTSAGIAICDTAHPDGDSTMIIEADIRHDTSGSSCDIIVGYLDSSNYFYVRYKFGTNSVDIRKVVSGTHSSVSSVTRTLNINTTYNAVVCVSAAGRISALLGANCLKTTSAQTLPGDGAGFGMSSTGNALFDNFTFRKTKNLPSADTCEECEFCGCLSEGDDFTRANSTDIDTGSDIGWTEVAGDWSISSNDLTVATANAIAISDTVFPDDEIHVQSLYAGTSMTSMTLRVIVNYVDSDNYCCGELSGDGTGYITASIIERSGGVETTHASLTGGFSDMDFCWIPSLGRAWFGNQNAGTAASAVTAIMSPFVSRQWGVGTGATVSGTARFNYARLRGSRFGCNGCARCGGYCYPTTDLNIDPATEIQVTLAGITDNGCSCAALNGTYTCTLRGRYRGCEWVYEFPSAICGYGALYIIGSNVNWTVVLAKTYYDTTVNHQWQLVGTGVDCVSVSGLSLTYIGGTGTCTGTGSSCTITAL